MAPPRKRRRRARSPKDSSPADTGSTTADSTGKIVGGMSEQQIREAGLAIDVPFESGEPAPERLQYADLGKTWTPPAGWPPEVGNSDTGEDSPS